MFQFSKKSWFILAGGLSMASLSLANTPIPAPFNSHFYIEGGAGYAITHYEDASKTPWTKVTNGNGGAFYTADIGYSFRPYFSYEVGGGGLPMAQYDDTSSTGNTTSSWYLYAGSRMNTTFSEKYILYSKVGGVLRHFTYHKNNNDTSVYYVAPMIGCGIKMKYSQNYTLAAEYNYLAGDYSTDKNNPAVHVNLLMLKVGYNFY